MDIQQKKSVCFTGHRPEKLPDKGAPSSQVTKIIKSMLYKSILNSVSEGYDTFFTGMQRGIDLWAGEIVLELMQSYKLNIVAVYPYRNHGSGFKGYDKWILGRITEAAAEKIVVSENYTPDCMKRRNRLMVDNSSKIIAVIDSYSSGTGSTLSYARSKGLETDVIDLGRVIPEIGQLTLF
ncbi:MAG: SLOG family protein [Huintestinicola sp.]